MHRLIEAMACQALTWEERDANEISSKFLLGILQSIAARVKQRERRASHLENRIRIGKRCLARAVAPAFSWAETDASRIDIEPLPACSLILYLQFPQATDLESIMLTTIHFLRCLLWCKLSAAGVCEGVQGIARRSLPRVA